MQILDVLRHNLAIEQKAYVYLSTHGLIHDAICITCSYINLPFREPDTRHFIYKYVCIRCGRKYNSFTATAFDHCRLRMNQIVFILYSFTLNKSVSDAHSLSLDILPFSISKVTMRSVYKKLRGVVYAHVTEEINTTVLEGPVEIDECLLYRGKKGYEGLARPYINRVWVLA